MIESIEKIDRVGTLDGLDGSSFNLERLSLIYAPNGRGKSTLATVLSAAGSGEVDSITERQTLGKNNPAFVKLKCSGNKTRILNHGSWTGDPVQVHAFDTMFIDRNVHTGGEVSPSHREGLLSLAIGSDAVSEQQRLEQANEQVDTAKDEKSDLERQLTAMARAIDDTASFDQFRNLNVVDDVDTLVADTETDLQAAHNLEKIYRLPIPEEIKTVELDIEELFNVVGESLSDLREEAKEKVETHIHGLAAHGSTESVDRWLREGLDLAQEGTCPFCGQSTENVDLVSIYADFFDEAYGLLREQFDQLKGKLGATGRESIKDEISSAYDRCVASISSWNSHTTIPELLPLDPVTQKLKEFGSLVDKLLAQKLEHFEKPVDLGTDRIALESAKDAFNTELQKVIQSVNDARKATNKYKDSLTQSNVSDIQHKLRKARLIQLRGKDSVETLFKEWDDASKMFRKAQAEAAEARKSSKQAMDSALASFRDGINRELGKIGALFQIGEVTASYNRGVGRTEYGLILNGHPISMSAGPQTFRSVLSEGDKRTLAFAFFCAQLLKQADLRGQVIVVDDPVTSLDRHRRAYTTNILNTFSMRGAQVIVLSHDATYLKETRDKFRGGVKDDHGEARASVELELFHTKGTGISFQEHDLDRECESMFFRNFRKLRGFVEGTDVDGVRVSNEEAGKAIRPLIESYLHRRFPDLIPSDKKMLGSVIGLIRDANQTDELAFAQDLVEELTALNEFSRSFHHDGSMDALPVQPDADEVKSHAQRALKVVMGAAP